MSKSVIFLDIDGVLNYHGHSQEEVDDKMDRMKNDPDFSEMAWYKYNDFDNGIIVHEEKVVGTGVTYGMFPDTVAALQELLDRSDADVVISSIWRKNMYRKLGLKRYDEVPIVDVIYNALVDQGLTCVRSRFIGITPIYYFSVHRDYEILAWLIVNPDIEHIVIIDDDGFKEPMKQYHVRTSFFSGGYQKRDIEKSLEILNKDFNVESIKDFMKVE